MVFILWRTHKGAIVLEGPRLKEDLDIEARIWQRRLQMILHSQAYYKYGFMIVEDAKFDRWARELADLQTSYPEISKHVKYADVFADWDGTTGMHLINIDVEDNLNTLVQLLNHAKRKGDKLTEDQLRFLENVERGVV